MKTKFILVSSTLLAASLLLSACGSLANMASSFTSSAAAAALPAAATALPVLQVQSPKVVTSGGSTPLSAYESALESIYAQVDPSVVSIQVTQTQASTGVNPGRGFRLPSIPGLPNPFGNQNNNNNNNNNNQANAPVSQALGSGFVWNTDGYIVTNNHVVNGADTIEVRFADGTVVPAKLVGTDPDSDLAVIKVDNPGFTLTPITMSDGSAVKVGQVAVAIGNPFGLENTMTAGIVSALGRTLPSTQTNNNDGSTYTIPDIIQTDASINPGNSGGPLVDDTGALIGVNSAIDTSSGSNSGVGFAIPSTIVNRVVPELIKNGKYQHAYLGVSIVSMQPDLAKAMNLSSTQRGALVESVQTGSPAEKAGLKGSSQQVTINGLNAQVGGDIITAVDGTAVKTSDDVIAYLESHVSVGQKVTLNILRGGKDQSIDVTVEARPANTASTNTQTAPQANNSQAPAAYLGIAGQALNTEINKQMNLSANQMGILVESVEAGSPADSAGLQGSSKPVVINGQRVLIGGDVITAMDGNNVASFNDLLSFIQNAQPGQKVSITILRNGNSQTLTATLTQHP